MMQDGRGPDFQSFLYAYALGCLDKEDYIHLLEHIESGENFSWQELGEFQNLAALLPSFLNMEEPAASVKDKVARRLYRIREDKKPETKAEKEPFKTPTLARTKTAYHEKLKTKITEKPSDAPSVSERISVPDDEIQVPQDFKPTGPARPIDAARPQQDTQIKNRGLRETPADRERFVEDRMESPLSRPISIPDETEFSQPDELFVINQQGFNPDSGSTPDQDVHITLEDSPKAIEPSVQAPDLEAIRRQVVEKVKQEDVAPQAPPPEIKAGISPVIFYLVVVILAAGIAGVYYMMNKKTTASLEEIEGLRKQVKTAVQTSEMNTEVLKFTALKESGLIALKGSGKYPDAFGQYIYNTASKQGYIMLANLPPTLPEYGYQLWYEFNKTVTPIGIPNEYGAGDIRIEYTKLANIPVLQKNQKPLYFVTQEKRGQTAVNPSKERFLTSEE